MSEVPFEVCSNCGGTSEECSSRRCWGWINGQRKFYDPAAIVPPVVVSEILPCRKCGDTKPKFQYHCGQRIYWTIHCNCGEPMYATRAEAIAAWNASNTTQTSKDHITL